MPADGSRGAGWHPEDWIWWHGDAAHPLSQSPVALLLKTGSATNIFRCPMDADNKGRIAAGNNYWYSYSVNGQSTANDGIASSWNGTTGNGWLPFRLGTVHHPSNITIMLAEEPTAFTPNEFPPPYQGVPFAELIDDGRWEPGVGANTITMRHSGKGNVNFADGHAQTVDYQFGADPNNINPVSN